MLDGKFTLFQTLESKFVSNWKANLFQIGKPIIFETVVKNYDVTYTTFM